MSRPGPHYRCSLLMGLLAVLIGMWLVLILTPALPQAVGLVEQEFSLKESIVILVGVAVALLCYWDARRQMHGR